MTRTQPSVAAHQPQRRSSATLMGFVVGLPLAAAIFGVVHFGPLHDSIVAQYLKHPAECVELVMFCVAIGVLVGKLLASVSERAALRTEMLPPWDGKPVPVSAASALLVELDRQPRRLQNTYLGRRIAAVLDFLRSRGSAAELDDHLRTLTDNDAIAQEGSYGLTRFITWAVPILGFLGTVLGITKAISGVNPEVLEKNLNQVTDGLAEAFDTTALALGLTMVVMFISYLVERLEQGILEAVDQYVDRHLAHRFARTGSAGGEFIEVLRQNTNVLVESSEQLVRGQAEVWAKALAEADRRRADAEQHLQERLDVALQSALDKTLEAHVKRLAALEKQSSAQVAALAEKLGGLAKLADNLAGHTQALTQLQGGERQLLRLQETMQQNLNALAGAGAFEQAVHSLTAAIHLLTLHAVPSNRRPGAAA